MLDKLGKAVIGVAKLPIDVAADVITLGGTLTDKDEPYTASNVKQVMKNLEDATK